MHTLTILDCTIHTHTCFTYGGFMLIMQAAATGVARLTGRALEAAIGRTYGPSGLPTGL